MYHNHYIKGKDALMTRTRIMEGQARAITRMIEEDRYYINIVQQMRALSAAADEIMLIILQNHIERCVADAIREQRGENYFNELMVPILRAIKH